MSRLHVIVLVAPVALQQARAVQARNSADPDERS
jgi:hypothetical protein